MRRCAGCGAEHPWGSGHKPPFGLANRELYLWRGVLCWPCSLAGGCPLCEGGTGSACLWHFV